MRNVKPVKQQRQSSGRSHAGRGTRAPKKNRFTKSCYFPSIFSIVRTYCWGLGKGKKKRKTQNVYQRLQRGCQNHDHVHAHATKYIDTAAVTLPTAAAHRNAPVSRLAPPSVFVCVCDLACGVPRGRVSDTCTRARRAHESAGVTLLDVLDDSAGVASQCPRFRKRVQVRAQAPRSPWAQPARTPLHGRSPREQPAERRRAERRRGLAGRKWRP